MLILPPGLLRVKWSLAVTEFVALVGSQCHQGIYFRCPARGKKASQQRDEG